MRRFVTGLSALALSVGIVLVPRALAQDQASPSLVVLSPSDGERITSTDIPVQVQVSNFTLSSSDVGRPDRNGEGHIHVMLDGMNMGVLFNFYTTPTFTLHGQGIRPGQHTITFDLASNTHMDMENTVTSVTIDYEPLTAKPLPEPNPTSGVPEISIVWPPNGATLGPVFTLQVSKNNFIPSIELEGKRDLAGYGHYHVFVDMDASGMAMHGGMMSMAGMIGMPGTDTIPIDLTGWPNGQHMISVEPVQDDHTPVPGALPAMITITLQGAATAETADAQ